MSVQAASPGFTYRVLLFGPERLACGKTETTVVAGKQEITVAELRTLLLGSEPRLAAALQTARFAINHEFADDNAAVKPHDEIALIGAVSGG